MANEMLLASATRLGPPGSTSALLRCGCLELPTGTVQRGFLTPQYALCWAIAGTGSYRDAAGREWPLAPGCAFQRFPDSPHEVIVPGHARWWYVAVPAPAWQALTQAGLPTQPPVITIGRDQRFVARFAAMVRRLRDAPEGELPGCLTSMLELIVDLHLRAARTRVADPHASAVDAACRAMAADPARRPSPSALARQVGMGYHAFRKAFARRLGCGVAAWALRQRLQLAQELLAERSLSVAEVAARVGYADPLQFSAIFRRHLGLSPRRWRRAL